MSETPQGGENANLEVLWEDGDRVFCRTWRDSADGERQPFMAVLSAGEHPAPGSIDRLVHEYGLKDYLDSAWAVRPLELVREPGQTMLVLDACTGEPLDRLIGPPMEVERFLRLAVTLSATLGCLHACGIVHKDIKPANILVEAETEQLWLMGFGIASRLPRERQSPDAPELIAGTLPYMSPEQTGRMNRSIDSRSDLYALGVTLYQMLTGHLPFTASDPMGWVHCHIARKPAPPSAWLADVPDPVSAIITKLLAKTPEERYQTTAGVESDLRHCLADWKTRRAISDFPLGARDRLDRLMIPEKLYGRDGDIETLLASFDRIVASGTPELMLVSGYSGIGKSSVVNELHKMLVLPRGLFASGKFDQYKRDIPYATLAQAFQGLIRPLLGKPEAELSKWREHLREALGLNGLLVVNLIPELTFIIGDQPAVSNLPPQEEKARFHMVLRRFIGVFARAEHPLALFVDDMQWLDDATLDLLEDLLTQRDVHYLMIIGAYRNNEVGPTHPLARKLGAIREAGSTVNEIFLTPLEAADLTRLVEEAVYCGPGEASSLAQLIHDKTAGNPFFAIQFMSALAEERLLVFDRDVGQWRWDVDRILAKAYTDNVVDLMIARLSRLSEDAQNALKQLACLGNSADADTLAAVLEMSEDEVKVALWDALLLEVVESSGIAYRFVHDRIHEAAYSLIADDSRPEVHLRIGRLLASRMQSGAGEERIFDVVGHLNRATAVVISDEEREQIARLNLMAAKRAKAATAYASALNYLNAGTELLNADSWGRRHELFFALELDRAECEFLIGELSAAERRLATLSSRAATLIERSSVACLQVDVYTTLDQTDRAIAMCLDYLRSLGIEWTPHPTQEEARREYERVWLQLGSREVEALAGFPLMSDPENLATLDVLTKALAPAMFTDANLLTLIICRMVNLSIEKGNSDGSYFGYVWFGWVAGTMFGNYKDGFRFGRLGYELVEQRGVKRLQPATYHCFATFIVPWNRHLRACLDLERQALEAANRIGDLTYAAYSSKGWNRVLLVTGDPLAEVQRQTETSLASVQAVRFGLIVDIIRTQLALILNLRGLTPKFGSFDHDAFNEAELEQHLASDPRLAPTECSYLIHKLQVRFIAGDYASAVAASRRAEPMLPVLGLTLELAEYHFYGALSLAATCEAGSSERHAEHVEILRAHQRQLEVWAENCPENFENRALLVGAEIARIEGRELDTEALYERAIRSAHLNGFVHNEAVASERAGQFYGARGFGMIADAYLRNARACYRQWGADGKVRQLDQLHPQLRGEAQPSSPTTTMQAVIDQLDLATVIRVLQAISSEIVLENLIDTLMRTAIEHAGAERGLLILPRGDVYRIEAEAATDRETVTVSLRRAAVTAADLPESVFQHVLRTREAVLLQDASGDPSFRTDEYTRRARARSILCLPLLKQSRLLGILYLENNLALHVFTPARNGLLELLAAQAAISLENTRLYSDLQEREAKIRRLVDANIIGICIFDIDRRIIEANDAFLRIVGYSRDDVISGHLNFAGLTPPEWAGADERLLAELVATGTWSPSEKELFRKDNSRVPVLVGGATFGELRHHGVAFVVDLTERRLAETEARESERRYREVQAALAHAGRVATMGLITASIAHEVSQPVSGAITNAHTGLGWLSAPSPDIKEATQALTRVVRDGNRARDVIERIRALARRAPPREDLVELNGAIREIVELTRSEVIKNGISVRLELADGLPPVLGDRVQLQQVMLNLVVNAIESMNSSGDGPRELLVATCKEGLDDVLVVVQDSGPGLADSAIDRLFDAFHTTKTGGLGLGLSISRSIIEAHGGRLSASANAPRGAVFRFTVPATRMGERVPAP